MHAIIVFNWSVWYCIRKHIMHKQNATSTFVRSIIHNSNRRLDSNRQTKMETSPLSLWLPMPLKKSKSLGSPGNRTAAQRAAATKIAREMVNGAPPNAIIAFTDGSSFGNPGPSGAGATVFFPTRAGRQGRTRETTVALGESTNNFSELWGIGAALQMIDIEEQHATGLPHPPFQ